MSVIDYSQYLDGDEWPSESQSTITSVGMKPMMQPVIDMPPQYAANALHKLVRWSRDGALTLEDEELYERQIRSSNLGRFLARRALGIEDFELYTEHGVDRESLSAKQLAYLLLDVANTETMGSWRNVLEPEQFGSLCSQMARGLIDSGYVVNRVSE